MFGNAVPPAPLCHPPPLMSGRSPPMGGGGGGHQVTAPPLPQFQCDVKKVFLRCPVFPVLFGPSDGPPHWRGGGGGLQGPQSNGYRAHICPRVTGIWSLPQTSVQCLTCCFAVPLKRGPNVALSSPPSAAIECFLARLDRPTNLRPPIGSVRQASLSCKKRRLHGRPTGTWARTRVLWHGGGGG